MSLEGNAVAGQTLKGRINAIDILTISAYGIAVKHGFKGTEEEWLASLEANPERIKQYVNEYLEENPTTVDTTLSLEGEAAEAKAVGEALYEVRTKAEEYAHILIKAHTDRTDNPHGVTKEQVGLGNVDNTSDMDKPVSTAQAVAIADAKKAGTDAQNTANSKALKKERTATLSSSGWSSLQQTVNVDGVTADNTVIVVSAPDSYMPCLENSIRCVSQAVGKLTFQCATTPTVNVTFNILILE